ncbi:MAG: 6-pyruvoyl trahydropterin synthase family protein [Pirellulales bacterium]|jgi:6-pyruvoyltetrahydropterin/6-carboxytetrahydropterin synthase
MPERFAVRLEKAVHVFSAGHFITLTDDLCEPVHGHNWTVAIDWHGAPDRHGMVVDFIRLRDRLGGIIALLDHRMLLATANPLLPVDEATGPLGGAEVTVRFGGRRWVFPADECRLLPLPNTTAEWLAWWIGHELLADGPPGAERLRVAVDECLGQWGVWEWSAE